MKHYLNFDRLVSDILGIYKDARDEYMDEDTRPVLEAEYDDDTLEEYAYIIAESINKDIKKYLTDHSMWVYGNFNNIHAADRPALLAKIESGCKETLDQMVDWFWTTFGTYGIKYNFQTWMSESIYQYEKETA